MKIFVVIIRGIHFGEYWKDYELKSSSSLYSTQWWSYNKKNKKKTCCAPSNWKVLGSKHITAPMRLQNESRFSPTIRVEGRLIFRQLSGLGLQLYSTNHWIPNILIILFFSKFFFLFFLWKNDKMEWINTELNISYKL